VLKCDMGPKVVAVPGVVGVGRDKKKLLAPHPSLQITTWVNLFLFSETVFR
jgi:hypothetical protein